MKARTIATFSILLLSLSVIAAEISPPGPFAAPRYVKRFPVGEVTDEDVLAQWGPPTSTQTLRGREFWSYEFATDRPSLFGPGVTKVDTYIFEFDGAGIVIALTARYSTGGVISNRDAPEAPDSRAE